MQKRILKPLKLVCTAAVFFLSFLPQIGFTLGFGPIKLFSHLYEPLDAEIELIGSEDVDASQLTAALASAQDFKRADLPRPYSYTKMRFEVVEQNNRHTVRVTTDEPIKEAYLEFLVALTWPEGRLLRGYTVLLDPSPSQVAQGESLAEQPALNAVTENPQHKHELAEGKGGTETEALSKKSVGLVAKAASLRAKVMPGPKASTETLNMDALEAIRLAKEKQQAIAPPVENAKDAKQTASSPVETESLANIPINVVEKDSEALNDLALKPEVNTVSNTNSKSKSLSAFWQTIAVIKKALSKNSLLLASGLALLFSVAFSIWVLMRARATLSVPKELSIYEHLENDLETKDEEISLKLDLAYQYSEIQDKDSAQEIIDEIMARGNRQARENAKKLLEKMVVS